MTAAAIFGLLVALGLALRAGARLLTGVDHRLVVDAVDARTAALTSVAHSAAVLGRSWFLILLTSVFALASLRRLSWRACGPLAAVLGAEALQHVVKTLVGRPRPSVLHLEHVTGSSFPSGHATESAAVAVAFVCLTRGCRRRDQIAVQIIAVLLVATVAASRVYLGVHYPSDVVAGIALGSAWGATASWWATGTRDRAGPWGQHIQSFPRRHR